MSIDNPLGIPYRNTSESIDRISFRPDIFGDLSLPAIESSLKHPAPGETGPCSGPGQPEKDNSGFEPIKVLYEKALAAPRHEPLIQSFATLGKSIAIYGGSFDPLHMDHVRVALTAIAHLGPDTVVVFMPNKQNPDKPGGPKTSNDERLEMLREGLSHFPGLYVSDFEMNSPKERPMTYDTMDFIRAEVGAEPSLRLILGSDILSRHHYFHGIEARSSTFRPLFIERSTFDASKVDELSQKLSAEDFLCVKNALISVGNLPLSSTLIRELLEKDLLEKELLPPGIFEIIKARSLYLSGGSGLVGSPPVH